jgi:hypothetical protein
LSSVKARVEFKANAAETRQVPLCLVGVLEPVLNAAAWVTLGANCTEGMDAMQAAWDVAKPCAVLPRFGQGVGG